MAAQTLFLLPELESQGQGGAGACPLALTPAYAANLGQGKAPFCCLSLVTQA